MKKILVLRLDDNYVDANGDIMPTDAKVEFNNDVVLTHSFRQDMANVLGRAQLFREGNKFYISNIQLDTPRGKEMAKFIKQADVFPAIGGMCKKRENKKVLDFSITMVSLSGEPNVDTAVKSIREQLEAQDAN